MKCDCDIEPWRVRYLEAPLLFGMDTSVKPFCDHHNLLFLFNFMKLLRGELGKQAAKLGRKTVAPYQSYAALNGR